MIAVRATTWERREVTPRDPFSFEIFIFSTFLKLQLTDTYHLLLLQLCLVNLVSLRSLRQAKIIVTWGGQHLNLMVALRLKAMMWKWGTIQMDCGYVKMGILIACVTCLMSLTAAQVQVLWSCTKICNYCLELQFFTCFCPPVTRTSCFKSVILISEESQWLSGCWQPLLRDEPEDTAAVRVPSCCSKRFGTERSQSTQYGGLSQRSRGYAWINWQCVHSE